MIAPPVTLRPLDDGLVGALLTLAVGSATPEEVMPPVAGEPGWSAERRRAFDAFYRAHLDGFAGPRATVMYVVLDGDEVAGMLRLTRFAAGVLQTGTWLGRGHRGRGVGRAALAAALAEARAFGAQAVVAQTTAGNTAALAVLRAHGARLTRQGDAVEARIDLASGPMTSTVD
jgi:RimJ/RimL family protein N-acetyltransferase